MMTLEQAIAHAEDVAANATCADCAAEHRQLATWLKELRARRRRDVDDSFLNLHAECQRLRANKVQ